MPEEKRKVLVALDGSEQALEAVRYLSRLPSKKGIEVVLFSVFTAIPEIYWDLEQNPKFASRITDVRAWQMQKENELREHMVKASDMLKKANFPGKNIKIKIQERREGITRDILKEARKHYSAVLVGRKGAGAVKNVVWGSVTGKLMDKLSFLPLIVVSRQRNPGRVLIGLDQSEGSIRAVDFVASVLGDSGAEIGLIHVIRLKEKQEVAEAEIAINDVFQKAVNRLSAGGIPIGNITTKVITGAESRSAAIVKEAKLGQYGTIVVGRRGLSKVKEFAIGRVANRVAQLAKGATVWIVN
ncbi:MAG: universal stress protein [Desulfobacteraceae bacterium]|jgi:nucleotide-binding universal stress UspA family protein|nr:MAG: universal stress protein [Desulfobacteraceae bacterium]